MTKNVVPIMYALSRNLAELYSMYRNIASQRCRNLIIHMFECFQAWCKSECQQIRHDRISGVVGHSL